MMTGGSKLRWALATGVACVVCLIPAVTWACGIFVPRVSVEFDSPQEADEALVHDAETMFYVDRGEGRWTVYQGRSIEADDGVEEFVWLLPVPGVPEVEVAPAMVFERLAEATEPAFELEERSLGDCPAEVSTFLRKLEIDGRAPTGAPGSAQQSVGHSAPVRAVDAGSVGPYEHVTIETEEGIDDPGEEAVAWLDEHGYRVESVDVDLLREYLDDGLNLLAMRLKADAGAEDVQPVAITVEMEGPVSPMRLAQGGAAEASDILVWTAGEGRALPHGWPRVEIDEGLVNWAEGGENYRDVVAAAVREAGGRGFVTDYAMDTEETNGVLWSDEERQRWEELRGRSDFAGAEREVLETIVELVGGEDLLTQILREEMPLPGRRALVEVSDLGNFSASYDPRGGPPGRGADVPHFDDPWGEAERDRPEEEVRWRQGGPGPDELLDVLEDGRLVAPCFARELEEDPTFHGEWSGRLRDPYRQDELVDDISSTLGSSVDDCIADVLSEHLEEEKYASKTFPASVSFRFTNPYEYVAGEEGFPALQASTYGGITEVDWAGVVRQVDAAIVTPLEAAQEHLDATARLTRLSTAVAAQNLTKDVTFSIVPGHGDVPALRRATRLIACDGEEVNKRAHRVYEVRDWSMDLERGETVEGRGGRTWPVSIGGRQAARLVVEYDRWGQVVDERGDAVDGEINYIEVDVDEEGNDGEPEEFEESEREVDDGAAPNEAGADEASEDEGDANLRWQWLLGALAAFSLVSLVVWALRRTDK